MKKFSKFLTNKKTISIGVLAVASLVATQGFCDTNVNAEMDQMTNKVKDVLFGPGIRKAGLALGFGAGLLQAFMSGSIRPLLIYGGIGLAVCYLPTMVDWIGGLSI
jgi:hypothetical protein